MPTNEEIFDKLITWAIETAPDDPAGMLTGFEMGLLLASRHPLDATTLLGITGRMKRVAADSPTMLTMLANAETEGEKIIEEMHADLASRLQ